jgi:hypothetical protein
VIVAIYITNQKAGDLAPESLDVHDVIFSLPETKEDFQTARNKGRL